MYQAGNFYPVKMEFI